MDKKTAESIEKYKKWQLAAEAALQASENEFGEVEFKCPLCGGNSSFSREYTPNNFHLTTIRGRCDKCDLLVLN